MPAAGGRARGGPCAPARAAVPAAAGAAAPAAAAAQAQARPSSRRWPRARSRVCGRARARARLGCRRRLSAVVAAGKRVRSRLGIPVNDRIAPDRRQRRAHSVLHLGTFANGSLPGGLAIGSRRSGSRGVGAARTRATIRRGSGIPFHRHDRLPAPWPAPAHRRPVLRSVRRTGRPHRPDHHLRQLAPEGTAPSR